jgi:hypothetical protein
MGILMVGLIEEDLIPEQPGDPLACALIDFHECFPFPQVKDEYLAFVVAGHYVGREDAEAWLRTVYWPRHKLPVNARINVQMPIPERIERLWERPDRAIVLRTEQPNVITTIVLGEAVFQRYVAGRCHIRELEPIYIQAHYDATKKPIIDSDGRGVFRFPRTPDAKTEFSQELLSALLDAMVDDRRVETVLQRTLVALMDKQNDFRWFNELNVAGGLEGIGPRVAIDLGRLEHADIGSPHFTNEMLPPFFNLDLFELKEWESDDTPKEASKQLFRYLSLYWSLVLRGNVEPYEGRGDRNRVRRIRLALLAPADFFRRHGHNVEPEFENVLREYVAQAELAQYTGICGAYCREMNRLRARFPDLQHVDFHPVPVVLADTISRAEFLGCFDRRAIEECLRRGRSAQSAMEILHLGQVDRLREWLGDAISRANM